jgi:hypothetical protein
LGDRDSDPLGHVADWDELADGEDLRESLVGRYRPGEVVVEAEMPVLVADVDEILDR